MKQDELKINGLDAYTRYGLFMTDSGLSALLAPRTPKERPGSTSRLESGTRTIAPNPGDGVTPLYESREFSMEAYMTAKSTEAFRQHLALLEADLSAGWLAITTSHRPGTIYRCLYKSTASYTQYQGRAAKLTLKFEEPNPANRS